VVPSYQVLGHCVLLSRSAVKLDVDLLPQWFSSWLSGATADIMASLKQLSSGILLAVSNVYGAVASFILSSIIFNSVDLRVFGIISLVLTAVTICQILFNTQSWQGILHTAGQISVPLMRRCLAIDVGIASLGSVVLAAAQFILLPVLGFDESVPGVLLLISINVAFIPPGTLIAVIRRNGYFASQALVDIGVASLKIGMAFGLVRGSLSMLPLVLALVLPEILRWCGYFMISASQFSASNLTQSSSKEICSAISLRSIYRFSIWGMMTEIIHLPTGHLDKLLVGSLLGLETLAIWDLIKRCAMSMVQITTVINQMLYPHFLKRREIDTPHELRNQCVVHCLRLGITILFLYATATLTLPLWFPIAFTVNQDIWPLDKIQSIFGLLALVMTFVLGAIPVHSLFLSLKGSAQSFKISAVGNLIFFVLSYFLLPPLALFGASLAILGSDAFIILNKIKILRLVEFDRR
jgi:O-antigen/teichoic acid export membrane protein